MTDCLARTCRFPDRTRKGDYGSGRPARLLYRHRADKAWAMTFQFDASGMEHFAALALDAADAIADQVVDDAKDNAPVATGTLRDSIHKNEPDKTTGSVTVVADAPYAQFVETGSAHHKAHPYLAPALYKTRDHA